MEGTRNVLPAGYVNAPSSRPASVSLASEISASADCANLNATAYQPLLGEVDVAFHLAATRQLPEPTLPPLKIGPSGTTYAASNLPCTLLKAIGWVESRWRQAQSSVPRGGEGPTLTAYSGCAYGLMQIASGMQPGVQGELPLETKQKIASRYDFNIGWGAKMLVDKWNYTPAIGERNPAVVEDWYYATWAYNYWGWKNNPNNPIYPWPRPAYDGTQPWQNYPYQELVWGYMRNPPKEGDQLLWSPLPATLPDRSNFPTDPDALPGSIPDPYPVHGDACTAVLVVNPMTLIFLTEPGGQAPPSQRVDITVLGGGSLTWQASTSESWLRLSPSSGSGAAVLGVSVNPPSTPGRYSATVTITPTNPVGIPRQVQVSLYVGPIQRRFFPEIFSGARSGT